MRLPKSRWAMAGVSVAAMTAVAGITLGVTTLLGVTFQGQGTQTVEGADPATRGPGVAICVQAVEIDADGQPLRGDSAIEAAADFSVKAALVEVTKRPVWDDAGLGVVPPVVDVGCPSPPLAVLGGPLWISGHPNDGIPAPLVTQASFYRLFVFVMPSLEEIDRVLAGTTHRRAAQEFISANISGEFTIAPDTDILDGTVIGGLSSVVQLGLIGNPCNNAVQAEFILYESTADPGNLLVVEPDGSNLAFDGGDA